MTPADTARFFKLAADLYMQAAKPTAGRLCMGGPDLWAVLVLPRWSATQRVMGSVVPTCVLRIQRARCSRAAREHWKRRTPNHRCEWRRHGRSAASGRTSVRSAVGHAAPCTASRPGPPCALEQAKLYYDALDVYESSEKEAYGVDAFRHAIGFMLRQERWDDAVELQMRFGAASDRAGASYTQGKAYLGAFGEVMSHGQRAAQTSCRSLAKPFLRQRRRASTPDPAARGRPLCRGCGDVAVGGRCCQSLGHLPGKLWAGKPYPSPARLPAVLGLNAAVCAAAHCAGAGRDGRGRLRRVVRGAGDRPTVRGVPVGPQAAGAEGRGGTENPCGDVAG
jgi:hypothetical protein